MIFIDEPNWPGHGRLWSHLISDHSLPELHDFAAAIGLRPGAFDHDHYDVPEELFEICLAAGAELRRSRELVGLLVRSGLRRRKRSRLAR